MKKKLCSGLIVFLLMIAGCFVYLNDSYEASEHVKDILNENQTYEIVEKKNEEIAFIPNKPIAGFIFYPGGKVDYEAYVPLMDRLAQKNILCVLVHMPFNLAVLDVNRADGIIEEYTQVEDWYMGGHSLGGAMASSYIVEHDDDYEGLVLLASYSTRDISDIEIDVLSLFGSNDCVMNQEKYEEYKSNLPKDLIEVEIEGGNHAGFGDYGPQDHDGNSTLKKDEQIQITAEEIVKMIQKDGGQ